MANDIVRDNLFDVAYAYVPTTVSNRAWLSIYAK